MVFYTFKLNWLNMRINWLKQIWSVAKHNAFTDLCHFKNHMYCSFREAKNHISGDGTIRILSLDQHGNIENYSVIRLPGTDLRDPKLSVTPDGKLLLLAYARFPNEYNQTIYSQPMTWFSDNGLSWSSAKEIGERNWWLWRLRWNRGFAHGFAYNRGMQRLRFYSGLPRRTFELVNDQALSKEKHHLGYPNESDILFLRDNTAVALVRRDADTCTAQLGIAKPPYKQWSWQDLGEYIGGPVMLKLSEERAIVAGRLWRRSGPRTAIWSLDIQIAKLTFLKTFPSAGDNSYPGLVKWGEQVYMSYYSSHQNRKSSIYLANFEL